MGTERVPFSPPIKYPTPPVTAAAAYPAGTGNSPAAVTREAAGSNRSTVRLACPAVTPPAT